MHRWPGNVLRATWIGIVGLVCALAYAWLRIGTLFVRDRDRRRARVARIRGRLLRWSMATLGATFVKLGQVMSSRPDLLPPEMIDELRTLQDAVPPFRGRTARHIVAAELGEAVETRFSEFDETPVAAASVAQVHRARLADGAEVAVKVLRPGVRRRVQRDGRILIFLARLTTVSRKARLSDPVGHMRHFVEGIIGQTDLRSEITNSRRFRDNFTGVKGVVFPAVYAEHSSERVLTMEFVNGTKVDQLGESNSDLARLTRTVFFKMCFQDGFVHADLHPGNMLLTADGSLAIFDLGLVKELVGDLMFQLVDFSKCVSMGTTDDFLGHLRRFHTYLDEVDWVEVERDMGMFVERFRGRNVAELEMGAFINELFALARRHQIRPIPDMTLVLVAVVTAEGISKVLDPDVNTFHEMALFLMPLIQQYNLTNRPIEDYAAQLAPPPVL